jgi:hypothetical protein
MGFATVIRLPPRLQRARLRYSNYATPTRFLSPSTDLAAAAREASQHIYSLLAPFFPVQPSPLLSLLAGLGRCFDRGRSSLKPTLVPPRHASHAHASSEDTARREDTEESVLRFLLPFFRARIQEPLEMLQLRVGPFFRLRDGFWSVLETASITYLFTRLKVENDELLSIVYSSSELILLYSLNNLFVYSAQG